MIEINTYEKGGVKWTVAHQNTCPRGWWNYMTVDELQSYEEKVFQDFLKANPKEAAKWN